MDENWKLLQTLATRRKELREELEGVERQIADLGVDINTSATRGAQKSMAETLHVTRETVRRYGRTYYRSIIRREGESMFISAPSPESIRTDVTYEIREQDGTVLGNVPGLDLSRARKDQLDAYLAADPQRKNIALVDVSDLLG